MKRLTLLLLLALLLCACAPAVLADPTNPAWDSLQIAAAYQLDSDLALLGLVLVMSFLGALAALIVFGIGRRRR